MFTSGHGCFRLILELASIKQRAVFWVARDVVEHASRIPEERMRRGG
jgi:hypothetical protein